jgi:C4-type Zn-finger protein
VVQIKIGAVLSYEQCSRCNFNDADVISLTNYTYKTIMMEVASSWRLKGLIFEGTGIMDITEIIITALKFTNNNSISAI